MTEKTSTSRSEEEEREKLENIHLAAHEHDDDEYAEMEKRMMEQAVEASPDDKQAEGDRQTN